MSIHAIVNGRPAPESGTPVLLVRPVRPEIAPEKLSRFGDDRWDLTHGIFEDHSDSTSINFKRLPQPWREAVKDYLWQLINEDHPRALPAARAGVRCSLRSVSLIKGPIERLIIWAAGRGMESFAELDAARLDEYLAYLGDSGVSYGSRQHSVAEVRRLWSYRDLVPPRLAMPGAPPWDDAPARELLGARSDVQPINRTPGSAMQHSFRCWHGRSGSSKRSQRTSGPTSASSAGPSWADANTGRQDFDCMRQSGIRS
ncbi:hypothetical protein AHiyo8_pI70000 (plasmid) [Arthrobacter sp. Hiyo8]|nr:hypothetical protein AHiyo8_pI70000 [Arthrobacter sp. Hiyo8]